MMTLEEAMTKASKLLRLSESSNPHEAALAAQRAQEILTRYSIDRAALTMDASSSEPEESIENFSGRSPLDSAKANMSRWKLALSSTVAKANQCRSYKSGNIIGIIGRASDVEKVRYLYDMLVREVDTLTNRHGKGLGKSWRNEFRYGVVSAIGDLLKATQAKVSEAMRAESTGAALVRINQGIAKLEQKDRAIDQWVRDNMRMRYTTQRVNANFSARQAGYSAGKTLNVTGARGSLSGGTKKLPQ